MPAHIDRGALVLESGKRVSFSKPVAEAIPFDGFVVVRLEPHLGNDRNMYAVDDNGEVLWQIGVVSAQSWLPGPFLGIDKGSATVVYAGHSAGLRYDIEARTGRVLGSMLTK